MKKYELLKLFEETIEEKDYTVDTLVLLYNSTVHFLKDKEGNAGIKKLQSRLGMIFILEEIIDDDNWEIGNKITNNIILDDEIEISDKSINALIKAFEEI